MGWNIGWAAILPSLSQTEEFSNVDLDGKENEAPEDESKDTEKEEVITPSTAGIFAIALLEAISSVDQFRQSYEVRLFHVPCKLVLILS